MFRDNRRGPPRGGFNDRGDRGFSGGGGFNQRPPVNVGDELDERIGPATGDAPSKAGAPAGEEPAQSEEQQPEDTENFGEESQGDGDLEEELDVPPPEDG